MKSLEEKSNDQEESWKKRRVTLSDVICNLAKKQSLKESKIKMITQIMNEDTDDYNNEQKHSMNDNYVKMDEEDVEQVKIGNEDLFELAAKDRKKFLSKIQEMIEVSQKESKVKDIFFISKECQVQFDYFLFFKTLLYHLSYFFLFGPLSLLFLLPIEGYNFVYNMNFIGFNKYHLISLMIFLAGAPNIIICIYFNSSYNNQPHVFEISELIFCCLAIFIRCNIMAVRYATTTSCFLQLRYDGPLPYEIIKREYVLYAWKEFDPIILDVEIYESIIRNQIDVEFFLFTCINYITDDYLIRFTDEMFFDKYTNKTKKNIIYPISLVFKNNSQNYLDIFKNGTENQTKGIKKNPYIEFYKNLWKINRVEEEDLPYYLKNAPVDILNILFSGRLFFRELVLHSEKFLETRISKLVFILIIIRSIMPILYRFNNGKPIFGNFILEYYIITLNLVISWFVYYLNVAFIEIADKDLNTRYLLMQYLSSLINPDKMSLGSNLLRNLPLMNIFCARNLNTWMNFRVLTLDIGKRYFYRLQIYASAFVFCYIMLTFSFVLGYFNIIQLNFQTFPLLFLIGSSEMLIFSIIVFRYLYLGAHINKFAQIHVNQLFTLKENINLIIQNFPKFSKMKHFTSMIFEKAKFVYDYLTKNKSLNEDENFKIDDDLFVKNLEEVISCIDRTIQKIEFQANNNSLKILETELNFNLIYKIYGVLITLVYSLIQVRINNFFKLDNK